MELLGLSIFMWITILVMVGKFSLSAFTNLPGDMVSLMAIGILLVTGTVSTELALNSFSDDSVWLILLLLVLVTGMVQSGVVDWMVKYVMGNPSSYTKALNRLMIPVALMSTILNNETIVIFFIRVVKIWCKRLKLAPSKMLLPLSYAAGLGGICTLIGTPPNIIVSYFYQEETGQSMHIFTPFLPGICCMIVGLITINLVKNKLIPVRKSPEETFENSQDYTVELLVPTENEAVGMTVEEAELNNVEGGHLIEIVRFDKEVISPVPSDEFILGGDRLVYAGNIKSLLKFRRKKGLVNATHHVFSVNELDEKRQFQMVSVMPNSSLIGSSMSEMSFEEDHNVVLVAVARDGERLNELPRDIELCSRDILLLEGKKLNQENLQNQLLFLDNTALPASGNKTLTATLILLGMILLSTFNVMPLLNSCILACFFMAIFRCLSLKQIQESLNWPLLCSFAGSICLGNAISETGLSDLMAKGVIGISTNPYWALVLICLIVTFITEFISNVGAAAVFAPVGYSIATSLGVNPMTFMVGIMISASSSFATPGSCDTLDLITGPGGYKFSDFPRIGVPMNFIILAATVLSTLYFYPFN